MRDEGCTRAVVNQVDGARFHPSDLPAGRVAVMFTADWCGYCRRFATHFKALQQQWMVDISDEDDPLWDRLSIQVVPTVILFEAGIPRRRWAGVLGAQHVEEIRASLAGEGT